MIKTENVNKRIKICVPVIGRNDEEILEMMQQAQASHADVVEWRVDYYENVNEIECVIEMLKKSREILKDKELLFTYRSESKEKEKTITTPEYMLLCKTAMLTKLIDYIDVEFLLGDTIVNSIVKHAKISNTKVLMSNHDWDSTPRCEIIENRLKVMLDRGADIAKVACTPRCEEDVEEMIKAGKNLAGEENIVLISMGEMGMKTRVHPELSNSCMTFASLESAQSAPGQINVEEMYKIINQ